MGLTQAKLQSKGVPFEVVGGYITIVDGRVWKGVVRRKKDGTVLWICEHVHSRPEYNARHPEDDRLIWECSALNCGREAEDQWRRYNTATGGTPPSGFHGEIELSSPMDPLRVDTKLCEVGSMSFEGRIKLDESGRRCLRVVKSQVQHGPVDYAGSIDPDTPTDDGSWPDTSSRELAHWVTAAGTLLDNLWGLTFRDPRGVARAEEPDYDIIRRLTPKKRSQAKKGNPHVRPKREGGSRLYEVVNSKGKVVATLPHRGKALKELERLEAKG